MLDEGTSAKQLVMGAVLGSWATSYLYSGLRGVGLL